MYLRAPGPRHLVGGVHFKNAEKKFSKLNSSRENLLKTNLKVTFKKVTITANIQQHKIKIRALEFFVIAGRNVTTSTSVQKLFKASVALFLTALMPLLP